MTPADHRQTHVHCLLSTFVSSASAVRAYSHIISHYFPSPCLTSLSHRDFSPVKMPPRLSVPARDRDYDYSNVGKVGRRTGVTLAPRPVDEHGLEEITGLFSSPRKPSPASKRQTIIESIEMLDDATTPQGRSRSQGKLNVGPGHTDTDEATSSNPSNRQFCATLDLW